MRSSSSGRKTSGCVSKKRAAVSSRNAATASRPRRTSSAVDLSTITTSGWTISRTLSVSPRANKAKYRLASRSLSLTSPRFRARYRWLQPMHRPEGWQIVAAAGGSPTTRCGSVAPPAYTAERLKAPTSARTSATTKSRKRNFDSAIPPPIARINSMRTSSQSTVSPRRSRLSCVRSEVPRLGSSKRLATSHDRVLTGVRTGSDAVTRPAYRGGIRDAHDIAQTALRPRAARRVLRGEVADERAAQARRGGKRPRAHPRLSESPQGDAEAHRESREGLQEPRRERPRPAMPWDRRHQGGARRLQARAPDDAASLG